MVDAEQARALVHGRVGALLAVEHLGGLLLGLIVGFYELAKTVWGQDARRNG